MKSNYNALTSDIRLYKIPFTEAKEILYSFKEQWIYIKFIYINSSENDNAIYSKFKVRNVSVEEHRIYIYGYDDEDRLIIDLENLAQTETSNDKDELLLINIKGSDFLEISIKKYNPIFSVRLNNLLDSQKNIVVTEGKTDWKHIKFALKSLQERGMFNDLDIQFFEFEYTIGNNKLRTIRDYHALFKNVKPKIFVFDRDDPKINREFSNQEFIYHGNNVYSFLLPVPKHRKDTPLISIEHYYSDEEIQTKDNNGRRLYLASEFDTITKQHKDDSSLYGLDVNKKTYPIHIVDDVRLNLAKVKVSELFKEGKNIALSKSAFSEFIVRKKGDFRNTSIEAFNIIFLLIEKIMSHSLSQQLLNMEHSKKISDNAFILNEDDDLNILGIHVFLAEDTIKDIATNKLLWIVVNVSDNKRELIFQIQTNTYVFNVNIVISNDLIDFIYKKDSNHFNRIELFIFNNSSELVLIKEILTGDIGATILKRAIESL